MMQQQQKQDIQAASMGAGAGTLSDANKLALKNLPQDTTDESLSKVLRELAVNPTKVSIQNYDKEFTAFIWFADSQSMCSAAATIDKASKEEKVPFKRANNRAKA